MEKETTSVGTTHHMATSIEGLLHHFKRKKITFMTDDDGRPMSDYEARKELAEMLARGEKLIQSEGCFNFCPINGCPGHTHDEIKQHKMNQLKAKLEELENGK